MKVELDYWLLQGKGSIGDNYYISPPKYEPGWGVVRRKPGPRNRHNSVRHENLSGTEKKPMPAKGYRLLLIV